MERLAPYRQRRLKRLPEQRQAKVLQLTETLLYELSELIENYAQPTKAELEKAVEQFEEACVKGNLLRAQNIHKVHNLTAEDARACNNCVLFYWAAEGGQLNILKWLTSTFNLTAADARANDNCAFRWTAENGHLKVLKWLTSTLDRKSVV